MNTQSSDQVLAAPTAVKPKQLLDNLSQGRRVVLAAAAIGLVVSFFPWYSSSALGQEMSISAWHQWGILAALAIILSAVVAALPLLGFPSVRALVPGLSPRVTDGVMLIVLGVVSTGGVILVWAICGVGASASGFISAGPTGWFYVFLVCALAAVLGGFLVQADTRMGQQATLGVVLAQSRRGILSLPLPHKLILGSAVISFIAGLCPWYTYSSKVDGLGINVGVAISLFGWHDWGIPALLLIMGGTLLFMLPRLGFPSIRDLFPRLPLRALPTS